MPNMNKVIICGRLTADPELRYTAGGTSVANFSVATNREWENKEGNKESRPEFHRMVVWGNLAENCNKYLKKGRQVLVEGRLETRSYDKEIGGETTKVYVTEIQARTVDFLGSAPKKAETQTEVGKEKTEGCEAEPQA